jgi:hypothetical protein
MYPSQHATLTGLALVPLRRRGWSLPRLGLFTAGAVLIDGDHYFAYALRTGDWSLPNAYRWHIQRVPPFTQRRPRLYMPRLFLDRHRPFHAVAPIALLFVLGWAPLDRTLDDLHPPGAKRRPPRWLLRCIQPWLRALAWGALFHRVCDYAVEVLQHDPGIPTEQPRSSAGAQPERLQAPAVQLARA